MVRKIQEQTLTFLSSQALLLIFIFRINLIIEKCKVSFSQGKKVIHVGDCLQSRGSSNTSINSNASNGWDSESLRLKRWKCQSVVNIYGECIYEFSRNTIVGECAYFCLLFRRSLNLKPKMLLTPLIAWCSGASAAGGSRASPRAPASAWRTRPPDPAVSGAAASMQTIFYENMSPI